MKKLRFAFFASVIFALTTSMGCNADIGEPEVPTENNGTTGNENQDNGAGTNGGENSGSSENSGDKADVIQDIPVEVSATDRGIKFSARILSNTGGTASATFIITEKESGIAMTREWKKFSDEWSACEMWYPFVNEGKEYTFSVSAEANDYKIYKGEFTVKATGGLGEFKIENAEECKPVLTKDRVIKRSGEPKYTDNPNVKSKILREALAYQVYPDEEWDWIFGDNAVIGERYLGKVFTGEFDLKDDEIRWKKFDQIDNALKGRNYRIYLKNRIWVAGYTDNNQTYFDLNEGMCSGEWEPGSERTKVYVVFGNYDSKYFTGLPGAPTEFTVTAADGTKKEFSRNCMIVDYAEEILEPITAPKIKNCPEAKFSSWSNSFPLRAAPRYKVEGVKTGDGKTVEYITVLYPQFSGKETYNVKISEVDADGNDLPPVNGTISLEFDDYYSNMYSNGSIRVNYGDNSSYSAYLDKEFKNSIGLESFIEGKVKDGSTVYVRADTSPAEGEEVVLFDPETYRGGGYAITKIDGESFAEITVDEYNTIIPIPEVDCSNAKSFTTKVCGKETNENFQAQVIIKDTDDDWVSNLYSYSLTDIPVELSAGFTVEESWNTISETKKTHHILLLAQDITENFKAQSGVTVYLGKVVAHF